MLSVTQLGSRLRVTVPVDLPDAAAWLKQRFDSEGVEADVAKTTANLEDVFVAATVLRTAAT